MRIPLLLLASALICLASAAARAQTVDQRALDLLGPSPNQPPAVAPPATAPPAGAPPVAGHAATAPKPREAARPAPPADPHAHPNGPHQRLKPPRPAPSTVPPTVPLAPPLPPVLPPPIIVPMRPVEPPAPPTVAPDAVGTAEAAANALRVTFGNGSADLNPDTEAALRHAAQAPDGSTFTVTAYATGTPEDPSTARRLALARALAVRSVLILRGVPSARIYLRALGSTGPLFSAGPPDRADLDITPPPPPAATTAPAPTPAPAPAQTPAVPPAPAPKAAPP